MDWRECQIHCLAGVGRYWPAQKKHNVFENIFPEFLKTNVSKNIIPMSEMDEIDTYIKIDDILT